MTPFYSSLNWQRQGSIIEESHKSTWGVPKFFWLRTGLSKSRVWLTAPQTTASLELKEGCGKHQAELEKGRSRRLGALALPEWTTFLITFFSALYHSRYNKGHALRAKTTYKSKICSTYEDSLHLRFYKIFSRDTAVTSSKEKIWITWAFYRFLLI